MPFYVVDSRGCVHFGPTPQEAVRKAREAKDDGSGNNNMDILEIIKSKGAEREEKKEQKINNRNINYLD